MVILLSRSVPDGDRGRVKTLSGKVTGPNREYGQNTIEGQWDGNAQKICANMLSFIMFDSSNRF